MITEIIPGQIYYQGYANPPFYKEVNCLKVNDDATIDTKDSKRWCTTRLVMGTWCETKEEAISEQVNYYFKEFHDVDMSNKADVYQDFVKNMKKYTKIHNPEYWL